MIKTVIITGGTSGIGLNLANFFYKKNFNVSIVGIANKSTINNLKTDSLKIFIPEYVPDYINEVAWVQKTANKIINN